MKKAMKAYDKIMISIGREECLTRFHPDWTLQDLVEEMEYNLSLWNDPDSTAYIDAHDEDQPILNGKKMWLNNWQNEKARMKRFINTYAPHVETIKHTTGQRTMKYIDIQNDVISKYKIDICDGTKCKDDWGRTHAHLRPRRVCKWKQANSLQSTFTLFHEIGHIMTNKSTMRRAEEEYYATVWAIEEMKKYNLTVPQKTLQEYQEYIDMEIDRGIRRGGTGYGSLKIV